MNQYRKQYPEQYNHPLVGKVAEVAGPVKVRGRVHRVVRTRFGPLAILEGDAQTAYAVSDCKEVPERSFSNDFRTLFRTSCGNVHAAPTNSSSAKCLSDAETAF
jgi:hypothetical protein